MLVRFGTAVGLALVADCSASNFPELSYQLTVHTKNSLKEFAPLLFPILSRTLNSFLKERRPAGKVLVLLYEATDPEENARYKLYS